MPTILNQFFGNVGVLSQATSNTPNISDINLEKSLQFVLPKIQIGKIKIEEAVSNFAVNLNFRFVFDFNIKPFREIIDKYFVLKIQQFSVNSSIERESILNRSLFLSSNNQGILKKSFIQANIEETGTNFIYNINFKDIINKTKNGEDFFNPFYSFYTIRVEFDEETFNKDFDIANFGMKDEFNGKAILLDIINNQNVDVLINSYETIEKVEWQGPINSNFENLWTYSQLYFDSLQISKRTFKPTSELNIRESLSKLSESLISNTSNDETNLSIVNVHTTKKLTFPPTIFFDIDWKTLVLKMMGQKRYIVQNNPQLIDKCKIKSIKLYKKRAKMDKSQLIATVPTTNNIPNLSDNSVHFEEMNYNSTSNTNIRNFMFVDKTANRNTFDGTYEYSAVFEIDNGIYDFLKQKSKNLRTARKELNNANDAKLVDSVHTFYNVLPLFSQKSMSQLSDQIDSEFTNFKKSEEEIRLLQDKIGLLDQKLQLLTDETNQKLSKTNKTTDTITVSLGKFRYSVAKKNALFDKEVEKPKLSVQDLQVNNFTLQPIVKTNFKPLQDEKLSVQEQEKLKELRNTFQIDGLTPFLSEKQEDKFVIEDSVSFNTMPTGQQIRQKETLFDSNISSTGLSDIFESISPNSKTQEFQVEYFDGYDNNNIKMPKWKVLENASDFENKLLLCRVRSNEIVNNEFFLLNDEKKPTFVVDLEFFDKDKFIVLNNKENQIKNVSL